MWQQTSKIITQAFLDTAGIVSAATKIFFYENLKSGGARKLHLR